MNGIGLAIAILCLLWMVITNIVYITLMLIKRVICKDVTDCRNRKCRVNKSCAKYNPRRTQEEHDRLLRLIDEAFEEETENDRAR